MTKKINGHKHKVGHKHGEFISIDFYAYSSKIRHWNPIFKVVISIVTILLAISLNNPYVSISVIIVMAYITVYKGGISIKEYLSILKIPIAFIIISLITIVFDFSKEPLGQYNFYFGLFYLFTSKIMIKEGIVLFLKIFASISAMEMMMLSTPSSEIIYVLRKAHMPKLIVELMNMIYRYIFILTDVAINMKNSALSRHGYCDLKTSWYTFGRIATNMLVVSLKKANSYYDAMEARCYDGELILYQDFNKPEKKLIVIVVIYILCIILIWLITR